MSETARAVAVALVEALQAKICAAAESLDANAFADDRWRRDGAAGTLAGRGSTRTLDGTVFERAAVNVSVVEGERLPPSVVAQRTELAEHRFFVCGVSSVLHPANPYAPTAHCNFRYFETQGADGASAWWFGGGADLTPYYPALEDVRFFHAALAGACSAHDPAFYPAFKAWCDRYFYLPHRAEARGVGGIFYDYLDAEGYADGRGARFAHAKTRDELFAFMRDAGQAFVDGYFPLVARHAAAPFGERERAFQLLRRGRYVEFNLLHDRGTSFGLQSGGRTESILSSLPPLVRWAYDEQPAAGSAEAELLPYLSPREWFAENPFA